jgi:hypothetical protein
MGSVFRNAVLLTLAVAGAVTAASVRVAAAGWDGKRR